MAEGGLSKNDDYECYLKDCPLYTSKKSDKTTSITIKFKEVKTYSKFRKIIGEHYGEENFKHKGKNGKNGYQCKSAEENVTLTLYDGTQKLLVQGTGHEQWFKEKFGRLAKQLHDIEMKQPKYQGMQLQQQLATPQPIHKQISGQRSQQPNIGQQPSPGFQQSYKMSQSPEQFQNPHSPTSITSCHQEEQRQQFQQQPHHSQEPTISTVKPQPSASMTCKPQENLKELQVTTYKTTAITGSGPLVSVEEFKNTFAIPYNYGDTAEPWPHTATLLCKYRTHATSKYYQDIPENTWQRIDNDPKDGDYIGEHAESIMIKKLTEIQEHLKKQPDYRRGSYKGIHTIDVILSYSPCNSHPHYCSTKLCEFKTRLEEDIRSAEDSSNSTTVETTDDASSLTQKMTNLNLGGKEKKGAKIEMNIQFSNFYLDSVPINTEGLKKLLQNGIALDILTGDKWNDFYKAIGFELPAGREEREKKDEAKFKKLLRLSKQ